LKIADESNAVKAIDAKSSSARIDRIEITNGGKTYYRFTIDRSKFQGTRVSINARVIDDDFGSLKQVADWSKWDALPDGWWQAVIR